MSAYRSVIFSSVSTNMNLTGSPFQTFDMQGYCIQAVVGTGTTQAHGVLELQGSNDGPTAGNLWGPVTPTNWTVISGSQQNVTGPGTFIWNQWPVMYNYVQLVYTDSSGGHSTALMSATITVKQ